jgi:hypothetical protein
LVEVATAAALVWLGKQDFWFLASVVPIGVVWLSTALVQVPLHTKLTLGYDCRTIHLLVQTNWLRTLGWTVRVVILFLTQR